MKPGSVVPTEPTRANARRTRGVEVRGDSATTIVALVAGLALLGVVVGARGAPTGGSAASVVRATEVPGAALSALAPDVVGRPWMAQVGDGPWIWGEAGTAGRHVLDKENGLAIGRDWLAVSSADPSGSHVLILDHAGAVISEHEFAFDPAIAAAAGTTLLFTGYGSSGERGDLVAIDTATGAVRTLVRATAFAASLGPDAMLGSIRVSASGQTAAIYVCHARLCETLAVDVASGKVTTVTSGTEGFLRAVTDELAIFTDADGAWIRAIEIATGAGRWTVKGYSLDGTPVATADGSIVATIGNGDDWAVRSVSPKGQITDLTLPGSALWDVWDQVSTPTTIVLAETYFGGGLADPDGGRATLIRQSDRAVLGTSVLVIPAN